MLPSAVDRIVDRAGAVGAPAVAKFLETEQKRAAKSTRVAAAIESESGRDARGWYARAGLPRGTSRTSAFIWIFEEYSPNRRPFIRPSLENNGAIIGRMFTRGRR